MIIETTYSESDFEEGKCSHCGDECETIVKEIGKCVDCVEEEKFFERTMEIEDITWWF